MYGSFLEKILRWDRLCANKSILIFHCNSVLISQATNFHTSVMEDTDHKDAWQRGTIPWSQSLLVGFGIGALLAYNFVQLDVLFQTKLYQKEMVVTFLPFAEDLITGGDFTADLASHAMFSLLLVVLTDIDDKSRKTVLVRATINEDITKRCSCFLKISGHELGAILFKLSFGNYADLFSVARTSEIRAMYWAFRLMSVLPQTTSADFVRLFL